MTRHLLSLSDLGRDGLLAMLDSADHFKSVRGTDKHAKPLTGKSIALVFEKASTRTRLSLEVAVAELGGNPIALTSSAIQLGRGEPISDTSRVLSRMVHGVTFRTFGHDRLESMAEHSSVPVLNALSDSGHPMQLLADLQTVCGVRKQLDGLQFVWVGDGNNMANSWIEAAGLLQLDLRLACPEGYDPDPKQVSLAKERGGKISILRDPKEACREADVISTDVFASMGQEEEAAQRLAAFAGTQVNQVLVDVASPEVMVLHCLPAHRGEEISAEVIDGPRSFVWDQAEARLHTAKAALAWALEDDG
ncbi:MAG: ornithine carbamoyltransferase [Polyangiaceae bacterium]|nr:ornithine carbamoyltransferase [Polyangiaceae bacterium]